MPFVQVRALEAKVEGMQMLTTHLQHCVKVAPAAPLPGHEEKELKSYNAYDDVDAMDHGERGMH
jgi:hypothetical protein